MVHVFEYHSSSASNFKMKLVYAKSKKLFRSGEKINFTKYDRKLDSYFEALKFTAYKIYAHGKYSTETESKI